MIASAALPADFSFTRFLGFKTKLKLAALSHGAALFQIAEEMKRQGFKIHNEHLPEQVLCTFRNLVQELIYLRENQKDKRW
jgi:hypothetical protein